MSDAFTLNVEDNVSDRLDDAAGMMRANLLSAAQVLSSALLMKARDEADGQMLKVRSGEYLASLYARVIPNDDGVSVELGSSSPKAVILEYGGTIGPYDIVPNAAQAMRFEGSVGEVFAKMVQFPGATIAARPVLETALADTEGDIEMQMGAVAQTFAGAFA